MIRRNRPQSIEIPERNQNEVVEVFLDELPDNPEQIKSIIIEEGAPIDLFLQFATEYYYQDKPAAFKLLVQAGLREGIRREEQTPECKNSIVALLSALAAFYIAQGLNKPSQASAFFEEATIAINEADKRDSMEESLWLRKGLLLLAQGKTQAAEYQFGIATSKDSENIPAHIGLVGVPYWRLGLLCILAILGSSGIFVCKLYNSIAPISARFKKASLKSQ